MEFLKERCFTALNADELRAGDKVIVADTIMELRDFIEEKAGAMKCYAIIKEILPDNREKRFALDDNMRYSLAYLVERKENCLKCKKCEVISDKSMHCDWVGTGPITSARVEKCNHYEPKTGKKEMCLNCKHYNKVNDFRDCTIINNPTGACPHYEAEPHYRPFKDTDELIKVWCEKGSKWQKREITMPFIWVRRKGDNGDKGSLITAYGKTTCIIAEVNLIGADMSRLFTDFEFLDGSPCGGGRMRIIDADKLRQRLNPDDWGTPDEQWRPEREFGELIDYAPTVDQWHYPSRGEYPTETDDYLVYVNTKAVRGQKIMAIATYYVGAKEWNIDTDEYEFKYPPIAWMPLPEPPKEEA